MMPKNREGVGLEKGFYFAPNAKTSGGVFCHTVDCFVRRFYPSE